MIEHIKDLTHDPKNARRHNPRNIGMIERSLNEVGAARSIVVDEDGVILAGNGLVEAAAQAGIERVRVIEADGDEIIAVRRRGLTQEQKTKLALYDNRATDLSDWEPGILAELAGEVDLSGLFTVDELTELSLPALPEPGGGGDEFDATPEEGETRTHVGELWSIGSVHRLLVGDCTDAANVARLMGGERAKVVATDPPYNVDVDYDATVDDDKSAAEYEQFSRAWLEVTQQVSQYQIVTPGGVNHISWARWFNSKHVGVWIKTNAPTFGRVSNSWCWEPVFFFGDKWPRRRANDVFDYPIGNQSGVGDHPCPKPLAMWIDLFENYSDRGDLCYEPFSGSGTSHIAAHRTGRRCYGMEIAPRYADVILRRAEAEGLETELISDA